MKLRTFIFSSLALALGACHTIDDDRIPYAPVRIAFNTQADWEVYGVTGALDSQRFIKYENTLYPPNFPFTELTYTGFGGVLLCGDIHGNPVAYDLSCPVERSRTVRVVVDTQKMNAYCPDCHSEYGVFDNNGAPLSGKALSNNYGLRRYSVTRGMQGEYRVILN